MEFNISSVCVFPDEELAFPFVLLFGDNTPASFIGNGPSYCNNDGGANLVVDSQRLLGAGEQQGAEVGPQLAAKRVLLCGHHQALDGAIEVATRVLGSAARVPIGVAQLVAAGGVQRQRRQ